MSKTIKEFELDNLTKKNKINQYYFALLKKQELNKIVKNLEVFKQNLKLKYTLTKTTQLITLYKETKNPRYKILLKFLLANLRKNNNLYLIPVTASQKTINLYEKHYNKIKHLLYNLITKKNHKLLLNFRLRLINKLLSRLKSKTNFFKKKKIKKLIVKNNKKRVALPFVKFHKKIPTLPKLKYKNILYFRNLYFLKRMGKQFYRGYMHIQLSLNNIIITVTDKAGNTKFWYSGGSLKFNGAKKSTKYVANYAVKMAAMKARYLGVYPIRVKINGPKYNIRSALEGFKKTKVKVISIEDTTTIPFNGCRLPKVRRKRRRRRPNRKFK